MSRTESSVSDRFPLSDRVALVTGASRGLGRGIARALSRRNAAVIAVARTEGALMELADEAIGTIFAAPLDLLDRDGIDRLAAETARRWGRLDILVHAAAASASLSPVPHADPKRFDSLLQVNAAATLALIAAFDPLLRAAPSARALFVDDPGAVRSFHGAYSASKAAMLSLARCYALETRRSSIRVGILAPPPMSTALRARGRPGEDPAHLADADAVATLAVDALAKDEIGPDGKLVLSDAPRRDSRHPAP